MQDTQRQTADGEALVARLFSANIAMMDVLSVYIGDRLGLYRTLAELGSATSVDLATRAGIHPRYAREWLEQQAATGILQVELADGQGEHRRFSLPAAHAEPLVDLDSPLSITPLGRSLVACARVLPALLQAYRSGGGVPWSDYGADMIEAQGDFNRPWLQRSLGTEYLPAIPDVDARLRADPAARVADVACGVGWAGIAIAKAYPKVTVEGFDPDESSVELARENAARAGVADRVTFQAMDASELRPPAPYDLAVVIESIHDMSRPVEVLAAMHRSLAADGAAIIADERAAESFTAPADEVERLLYGFSILCCLPAGMAEEPSAATGTVMRPDTLRRYAEEAGFRSVEVLDLEHDLMRFYRLAP